MISFRARLLAALVLFLGICVPSRLHAGTGIGVEGGCAIPLLHGNGIPYVLGLTFKSDKLPLIMGAKMQLTGNQVSGGGATADIWLGDIQIGYSIFNLYYGPGATILYLNKVDSGEHQQSTGLFIAPRFFAGINTMLSTVAEMYLQVTVEPGMVFAEDEGFIFRINQPVSLGVRFWF
jgi:hypothetical protein